MAGIRNLCRLKGEIPVGYAEQEWICCLLGKWENIQQEFHRKAAKLFVAGIVMCNVCTVPRTMGTNLRERKDGPVVRELACYLGDLSSVPYPASYFLGDIGQVAWAQILKDS